MLNFKFYLLSFLVFILLLLSSCAKVDDGESINADSATDSEFVAVGVETVLENGETVVLPSYREGYYGVHTSDTFYVKSLDSLIQNCDAVALIKIGNWVDELEEIQNGPFWSFYTKFEAEVIDVFKGDLPSKISFLQFASAEGTFAYYPCYTYGNEILVFLRKIGESGTYYSYRSYLSEFDVITASDDSVYVADIYDDSVFDDLFEYDNSDYETLKSELLDQKMKNDTFWNESNTHKIVRIISLDMLDKYFSENYNFE